MNKTVYNKTNKSTKSTVKTRKKVTAVTGSQMKTVSNIDTVIFEGITNIVKNSKGTSWEGTMTDLNTRLISVLGGAKTVKARSLPGSPSALRVALNRVVSRLRANRVSVKFFRTQDHAHQRLVKFSR